MRIFVCCISSVARTCILYFFHSTNQHYSKWLSNLHHINEMLELFTSTFLCSASPNKWVLQRMHNAVCVSCFLWICVRARLFSIVHAHKFYFTDDNAIFFSFGFRWSFFFVLHVRVIRMRISKQQQLQTLHAIDLVASRASRMRLKIFLISRLVFSWAFEQVFNAKIIEKVFHISKQKPMRFRFVCFFLMHNFSIPSSHTHFQLSCKSVVLI